MAPFLSAGASEASTGASEGSEGGQNRLRARPGRLPKAAGPSLSPVNAELGWRGGGPAARRNIRSVGRSITGSVGAICSAAEMAG